VFDYFIHSLYTVINTQRGRHTLKLKKTYNVGVYTNFVKISAMEAMPSDVNEFIRVYYFTFIVWFGWI